MSEENATVSIHSRKEEQPDESNYHRRMAVFKNSTSYIKRSAIEDEIHRDIFWDSRSAGEYANRCQKMRILPDMKLWQDVNP